MFKINEYVVYKRDVCKVTGIKHRDFNNKDYYILSPIEDDSLTIEVPTENINEHIRTLISSKEVEEIIQKIPSISILEDQGRMIENEYKKLLNSGEHLDLIKIIKTALFRNNERKEAGKRLTEKDSEYFKLAENMLYNEFALVLGMNYEETKKYVTEKVSELLQK